MFWNKRFSSRTRKTTISIGGPGITSRQPFMWACPFCVTYFGGNTEMVLHMMIGSHMMAFHSEDPHNL